MPRKSLSDRREYNKSRQGERTGYVRIYRGRNPEKVRKWKEGYYLRIRERKAGRPKADNCELCGILCNTQFDHCHITGRFRGWLCGRCNRLLGHIEKNIDLVLRMLGYLEQRSK